MPGNIVEDMIIFRVNIKHLMLFRDMYASIFNLYFLSYCINLYIESQGSNMTASSHENPLL